jgi:DNA (cytosine-5)-methyltransferase 1
MCGAVLDAQNVKHKHNLKERYNVDNTKTITHLSLCSGYEGIGLGLRRVLPNLREIAYVEREGFPVANLVAKMEAGELDAAPVFTDVKTFPYGEFRGCVDILSGGFPCQPFSAAGKREGVEDPRHLFPYIANGIRECQPRIVFLENVEGIISAKTADGESVLQYVLRELEGLGYRATAGVFSAAEVGAPHQRKRVFILGMENASVAGTRNIDRETEGAVGRVKGVRQGDGETGSVWTDPTSSEELANSNNTGLEGHQLYSTSEQGEPVQANTWATGGTHWPSRPGETQHDWEEPRVTAVVNTTSKRLEGSRGSSLQGTDQGLTSTDRSTGQAEPGLGRATNGSSSRVDRLRLLGNGVVPATAAKAFLTLIQRLND